MIQALAAIFRGLDLLGASGRGGGWVRVGGCH